MDDVYKYIKVDSILPALRFDSSLPSTQKNLKCLHRAVKSQCYGVSKGNMIFQSPYFSTCQLMIQSSLHKEILKFFVKTNKHIHSLAF